MDIHALRATLDTEGRLELAIRVIPKSQQTMWAGTMADGTLKIKLAAVPERGRANDELVRFLAAEFAVRRAQIEIVAGHTSQRKQIRITR